jgi:ribosomal protein S6E (S10)
MATVEEVYFYDINGNKYDATIDGLSSTADYVDEDDELEEDDEDLDGDEMDEEEEDEECQVCGGDDDTGEGICSDCQLDRAD